MAGWCSESESDDEPLNIHLFARKSFAFQGFSEEKERTLKNIVTQIGAVCDDFPKYIFTTEEHFKSLEESTDSLYNVTYIRDCVDANRCLTIEPYRFGPKYVEKKDYREFDPCCNNFHNGQEACIVCDSTFKPEVPVKQKKKVKHKPKDEITNSFAETKNPVVSKKLPKNLCAIENCTVSPDPHPIHPKKNTGWEPWEVRLLLDYIIVNKLYFMVKSPSLYRRMFNEGFLTHRTPEAMRVYFRSRILRSIESYDLPKPIMRKLKQIRNNTGNGCRSKTLSLKKKY